MDAQMNREFVWNIEPVTRTRQGWLYLEVIIDLFARNVVGWHSLMRTCTRRADDGRLAVKTGRRDDRALSPGQPVRQRRLATVLSGQ